MRTIRDAINHIIRYWNSVGDNSAACELVPDAIIHIRCRMDRGMTAREAALATLQMRIET